MSVQSPSGLLNVKGAFDPWQVMQHNIELLNLSLAFSRVPSRIAGVETTQFGPPTTSGVWPNGTLWVDVGKALWMCIEHPGDALEKWRQLDYALATEFPAGVPDGYLVLRLDQDRRMYRWNIGTTTWEEQYLSIKGATFDGVDWHGTMQGPLLLWRDPVEDMEAVPKRYLQNIVNPLTITSFTARGLDGTLKSTVMIGKTISQVQFDWAYSRAVTSQSISGGIGSVTPVSARTTTAIGLSITTDTTWTLTASDGVSTKTANSTLSFRPPVYVGADVSSTPNDGFIVNLPYWLQSNPFLTTNVTPNGKYLWICYPASWATAEIWVNGLKVTDWELTNPFSHTNPAGYVQNYKCFRSRNILNGTTPLSVQIK